MSGGRQGKILTYTFTALTILIALSMALPFCGVAGT
jgi:hypothetical protein